MKNKLQIYSQYIYGLIYSAQSAKLKNYDYRVDFYDWVLAGVCCNSRGVINENLSLCYFVDILMTIRKSIYSDEDISNIEKFVKYFYDDIIRTMSEFIWSSNEKGIKLDKTFMPIITPHFDEIPNLSKYIPSKSVSEILNEHKGKTPKILDYFDKDSYQWKTFLSIWLASKDSRGYLLKL